jgi:Thioredoxin domain-containing protein
MKKRINDFRLKAWHFCLLLVGLFIVTNICYTKIIENNDTEADLQLKDIDINTISHETNTKLSFVLVYTSESDHCKKMEQNMLHIVQQTNEDTQFFKLNLLENKDFAHKYNISGVPCIIVFKNNVEIKRIMGVVSPSNFDMIYNRLCKI